MCHTSYSQGKLKKIYHKHFISTEELMAVISLQIFQINVDQYIGCLDNLWL